MREAIGTNLLTSKIYGSRINHNVTLTIALALFPCLKTVVEPTL